MIVTPSLLICLTLGSGGGAQIELPPAISSSTWTSLDGLPQDTVNDIVQDKQGYLWVCTFGGLARFDGRRFEVFDVGNCRDLAGNRFRQIERDPGGGFWLLTLDVGLLRFDGAEFRHVEVAAEPTSILVDGAGTLWGNYAWGVGRIKEAGVERARLGATRSLAPSSDGGLWISTMSGDLVHWRDGDQRAMGTESGLSGKPLAAMVEDSSGRLWVGNHLGAWRATDASNSTFERLDGVPAGVSTLLEGVDGELWIGTRDGLYRWDPARSEALRVAGGSHACLLLDERRNLWAGSRVGGGLQCFRAGALHDATEVAGLEVADSWAVTAGRDGAVLVVQGRDAYEVRGAELTQIELTHNARTALVDSVGDLWIGGPDGLQRVRGTQRTRFSSESGLEGAVRALYEDHDGSLLVGTSRGLYRRDGGRFELVPTAGLSHLRCLLRDERGALWIGTQVGLARIEGGEVRRFGAEDGLSPGSIRTLHLDEDGVMWAGAYGGGLSRIEGDAITRFTRETGLAHNFLACILEDDAGRFWINSNSGPFVVRREDLNRVARGEAESVACVTFSREEGAREANGGNQPSGWRSPDGWMWFPSTEGVTVALPEALPLDEAPPRVHIEALELGENRALEVRYTALGFSSPARVQFRHRLLGQDADWVVGDPRGVVNYSYLPPGDYQFLVHARNGFGPWSETVGREFEVRHRFHETRTFFLGVVLLVALVVGGLAEQRIKRSRILTAELVRNVAEREQAERSLNRSRSELRRLTRELLTSQEQERGRISRELHDDVTQRLAALALNAEMVEARLDSQGERARDSLRRLTEEIQQLASDVQQLSRRLHPVGLRTLGVAEAMRQECAAFKQRNGIEVALSEDIASDEFSEEVAVAAFRIFQESLHNIEKHAAAQHVEVEMVLGLEELELSINDDGRGFEAGDGADVGLGLITMRERAASVGGEVAITSRPGGGTRVQLRAPTRSLEA